jgi:hypothetical protein
MTLQIQGYLIYKMLLKISKVVAKQFYPRFVREYNEQFPFTVTKIK